jgi:acetyl esterase/lipase
MKTFGLWNWQFLASVLVFCLASGCHLSSVHLWSVPDSTEPVDAEIESVRNVAYYQGLDFDDFRHRLDIYVPKGKKDFPVIVLVHGGAWTSGNNCQYGLFASVGQFLAQQGIGVVLPNYRISPAVKHPEHILDVARAFAWTHQHIAEYGGNPEQLFLAGHSAGGHLVSLLATDESYLQLVGLQSSAIKGVISISGVYHISPKPLAVVLGGTARQAVRIDQFLPLRNEVVWNWSPISSIPIIPLRVDAFSVAFGDVPEIRLDASPIQHVRPGLPPFLLFIADRDLPTIPEGTRAFQTALVGQGVTARVFQVNQRNHHSIMFRAVSTDDPAARLMLEFVRQHSQKP